MPRYDGDCQKCGTIEIVKRMNDPFPRKCPSCGGAFARVFNTDIAVKAPPDSGWESENGGRGRYISQLQREPGNSGSDPEAFCRSQSEIFEKCKRRGLNCERAR